MAVAPMPTARTSAADSVNAGWRAKPRTASLQSVPVSSSQRVHMCLRPYAWERSCGSASSILLGVEAFLDVFLIGVESQGPFEIPPRGRRVSEPAGVHRRGRSRGSCQEDVAREPARDSRRRARSRLGDSGRGRDRRRPRTGGGRSARGALGAGACARRLPCEGSRSRASIALAAGLDCRRLRRIHIALERRPKRPSRHNWSPRTRASSPRTRVLKPRRYTKPGRAT